MSLANRRSVTLLLADDNEGDARLALEVLKGSSIDYRVFHVRDGLETMRFLRNEDEYTKAPRPDLILLDLNMPRMDGREVLEKRLACPRLSRIPVIVFTISESERDVRDCYDLKANCYVTKPLELDHLVTVMQSLEQFWFRSATLPVG